MKNAEPDEVHVGCNGVCPSCSSFCPLDAIACPLCDIPLPQRNLAPPVNMTNTGEKICPHCGHKSGNDAAACHMCEVRVRTNLSQLYRPTVPFLTTLFEISVKKEMFTFIKKALLVYMLYQNVFSNSA